MGYCEDLHPFGGEIRAQNVESIMEGIPSYHGISPTLIGLNIIRRAIGFEFRACRFKAI
jgi:hypothetical protein